jgi:hypothetical protein
MTFREDEKFPNYRSGLTKNQDQAWFCRHDQEATSRRLTRKTVWLLHPGEIGGSVSPH